jgi:quinol monooxygenase YgiN
MIHVLAIITTKPGLRESVLEHFHAVLPAVQAEKGCIEYGPAVNVPVGLKFQTDFGPDTYVVVEKWESVEALQAHLAAPHMAAYAARVKEMIADRVLHVLTPA